jgi:hypothetical protein
MYQYRQQPFIARALCAQVYLCIVIVGSSLPLSLILPQTTNETAEEVAHGSDLSYNLL